MLSKDSLKRAARYGMLRRMARRNVRTVDPLDGGATAVVQ